MWRNAVNKVTSRHPPGVAPISLGMRDRKDGAKIWPPAPKYEEIVISEGLQRGAAI